MAAATVNSVVTCAVVRTAAIYGASSPPVLGLPAMARARGGRVRCSISEERAAAPVSAAAALLAAAAAGVASPAMALVDERLSTEGTGLSLGISNNLLGWILLGVFALIWSLFFVYTSSLDEDEDSGLSL
ncbi:unnamed protein product [Spirodela intermedia]|uniref:PSII 6.1 kDa protein n=1 Tax=Spirodela intermedia TaxID=51605 RepID=A0A7I8KCR5_SPIIN|nr:unnamed protein product [Spirodela intermedia]